MDAAASPLVLGFVAGFFLLAVLTLTSFVKLSVVLMILRQALGLQQVPSNIVVMALALFLSVYISLPVIAASSGALMEADADLSSADGLIALWRTGIAPFQAFLGTNIDPQHIGYFVDLTNELWRGSGMTGDADMFIIQVPSFLVSELTEAFRIGFLLYLPFVAIDLAITGILMALGMQMVQPNIIAVPFKLLLFVFVDGWSRLAEGLVLTYVVA